MKLLKLPAECIQRLIITKTQKRSSLGIKTILAMVLGLSNPEPYTIEELDKLGILPTIIDATLHTCNEYNLTKEALELFDEIKSNSNALDYFMRKMLYKSGKNLRKDPGVKQYILDTLIGPEWKEPDFYLYDDASLRMLNENLRRKKNISSILCDRLCIFNDIPKDRLNKFYDALRRLKPYIKHRGFHYTIGNEVRISYKSEDFPISAPEFIKRLTTMNLYWHIKNNQLIIEKTFGVHDFDKLIPRNELEDFLKRLKEKYPKQMQEVGIKDIGVFPLYWKHSRKYNLPDDLRGLNNM